MQKEKIKVSKGVVKIPCEIIEDSETVTINVKLKSIWEVIRE